jgi:hypothetical protein
MNTTNARAFQTDVPTLLATIEELQQMLRRAHAESRALRIELYRVTGDEEWVEVLRLAN